MFRRRNLVATAPPQAPPEPSSCKSTLQGPKAVEFLLVDTVDPLLSYGDLTQEELLDYYSFNQTEDGGFLNQIWNLTNGPLQYSDDPSLELLNYTSECCDSYQE